MRTTPGTVEAVVENTPFNTYVLDLSMTKALSSTVLLNLTGKKLPCEEVVRSPPSPKTILPRSKLMPRTKVLAPVNVSVPTPCLVNPSSLLIFPEKVESPAWLKMSLAPLVDAVMMELLLEVMPPAAVSFKVFGHDQEIPAVMLILPACVPAPVVLISMLVLFKLVPKMLALTTVLLPEGV